jgi:hypothetical protein
VCNIKECWRALVAGPPPSYLRLAIRDLEQAAVPMPDRATEMIGASDLYEMSLDHMDANWTVASTCWRAALAFLDGLMIVIALMTGIRLRTLSLATTGAKGSLKAIKDFYRLYISTKGVKTRKKLHRTLRRELTPYVEHSIAIAERLAEKYDNSAHSRPTEPSEQLEQLKLTKPTEHPPDEASLADTPGMPLWVTRTGKPMSKKWIGTRISKRTKQLTGVRLPSQKIRRMSATSLHRYRPRDTSKATQMYQHHSARQTFEAYVKTDGRGAAREFHELLKRKLDRDSNDY